MYNTIYLGGEHVVKVQPKTIPMPFSNSLITRKGKTKELPLTVVWIPDLNQHKILRTFALIFSKNYDGLRSHINSKECFIRYPNTSKSKHSFSRLIYYPTVALY